MHSQIRVIFVDIDWTILNHTDGHVFDYASIEALKEAQSNGYKVVLCTARPHHSVSQIGLFDMIKPDGYICANGGLIVIDDQIIYQTRMPLDSFEKLCEVVIRHGYTMECVEPYHRFLIAPKTDYVDYLFNTYHEEVPPLEDYRGKDDIISCLLFSDESSDDVIKSEIPSNLEFYRFHPYGVDVVSCSHIKGNGVKMVLDYLKLNKDNALAFGDDYGDISMFEEVKYSVCMGNGREDVKPHASIVAPPVWESGVKQTLQKLEIIK